MILQADTRQKRKHHTLKEKYFAEHGIEVVNSKMLVGDYCIPSRGNIAVDTKADCRELYSDLIQQHDRFKRECELAKKSGIQLYILVENTDNIKSINDITKWKNPQYFMYLKKVRECNKKGVKPPKAPATNVQLLKIMYAMEQRYGVKFEFTHPTVSGQRVLELLEVETPVNDERNS